uniref:Anaphase-promoting complex subunit 4 WD40 domain-containing protein n=1 Tax=Fibrocapsa japonica TaxID=94617 RepID=A0A7S2Y1Z6_9STRA
MLNEIVVEDTIDATHLVFSPDGSEICIQDSCLHYLLLVYSIDGHLLCRYQAYEDELGLKGLSWSPSGQFLALGSYDQTVRLMTPVTWKPALSYPHAAHPSAMPSALKCVQLTENIFVERVEREEGDGWDDDESVFGGSVQPGAVLKDLSNRSTAVISPSLLKERQGAAGVTFVRRCPRKMHVVAPDPRKADPRLGVGQMGWSHDGRYLATRNDNMPTTLWIWDTHSVGLLSVAVFLDPIRSFKWSPNTATLALCSGNQRVYLWKADPSGVEWVDIPGDGFACLGLRWAPGGQYLALLSRDTFFVCSMVEA